MREFRIATLILTGLVMAGCIDFFAEPPPAMDDSVAADPDVGVEPAPDVGFEPAPDVGFEPASDVGFDARPEMDVALAPPPTGFPLAPDGLSRGDEYGHAIATTDRLVAIGAPGDSARAGGSSAAGAVHLYHVEDGRWTRRQLLEIEDPEPCGDDRFGVALDMHADALVVGALRYGASLERCPDREVAASSGAAFVFEPGPDGAWTQVARLTRAGQRTGAGFGSAVAVWQDRIVVGAPGGQDCDAPAGVEDPCAVCPCTGQAYVYRRVGDRDWRLEDRLEPKDGLGAGDAFGFAVDIDDGIIAVSARHRGPTPDSQHGTVYLFRLDDAGDETRWLETAAIPAPAGTFLAFGQALALAGDTLAVSNLDHPDFGRYAGAVFVYRIGADGAVAGQPTRLEASMPEARALFGAAMALSGDRLLVGAPGEDIATPGRPGFDDCRNDESACLYCPEAGQMCNRAPVCSACDGDDCRQCDAGVAYAFRRNGARWDRVARWQAAEPALSDHLGTGVAWFGEHALVGLPQVDLECGYGCSRGTGAVRVFGPD